MILTKDILDYVIQDLRSPAKKECRMHDYKKWLMLNGKTHEIIKEHIQKEFKKPETIEELSARLVPVNILQKIITKLAGVYVEAPARYTLDKNTSDEELLEEYIDDMQLNVRMKEANRYFKLYKRNLMEIYVDEVGYPQVRNLPKHTYEVYSFSKISPNKPDVVVKILKEVTDLDKCLYAIWTDENHVIVNGKGDILFEEMQAMGNTELVNPYGKMPFVYINESSLSVDPIQDDDLVRISITIPVILTDLCFAQKYMSWGIIYTIGDVGDVPVNPNSVIPLNYDEDGNKPEIGTIKPEVDTEKVLTLVKTLIAILLSTKNLSVGAIKFDLNAQDVASGVAKMIDSAESVEDKKDQQSYFMQAEDDLWSLIKNNMIPYWRANGMLADEFNKEFSPTFEVQVIYQEPKVLITDSEKVDLAKKRLDAGFSTLERELAFLYPAMTKDEISELALEISQEKEFNMQLQVSQFNGVDNSSLEGNIG